MLKDMCHDAAIGGRKTNHSLRATGASELFAAGVPEKIIKERTGHRSLEALHVYEHTTSLQHQAVSTILSSSNKTTFQDAMLTPSTTAYSAGSSSTPYAPNNIFQNCSVQVIHPDDSTTPAASTSSSSCASHSTSALQQPNHTE